jgi:IS1 family transposase
LWLCVMLYYAWPSACPAGYQKTPQPAKSPRRRSHDPKPFPGLTRKPHCAACEQAAQEPVAPPPPTPPPPLTSSRGRPRQVDTSQYFLHHVRVTQIQLDELYVLLSAVKDDEVSAAEALKRLSRSPHWVWVAIDPVTKLLLAIDVGARTLAMAQCFVHQVAQVLAPACVPLFLTDGYKDYMTAVLTHFGSWVERPRQRAPGPAPKPRWMPLPQLLYAQMIKVTRRRRLVRVSHRVVFGTLAVIEPVLAAHGWQINTACIERVNLTIRQHVAAVGRRVMTLCKGEDGLRHQRALYQTYYNFCLPHASLRQPLPQPEPTKGNGSAKRWRLRTPAMAAGLTDHVWTLREVLLFRLPPWPQPQCV